ncbi:uncharacterized protein LOC6043225 [Culex quinquefasciatus]|uniref:uncharacterized protein LOC6043225 n=1 Tax=Culex quinquefasciatus TaxID=7176 RepID=UPI0018E2D20C|nr:uncharacterized protein LOC6043225 [Culex quinquefasciatus]
MFKGQNNMFWLLLKMSFYLHLCSTMRVKEFYDLKMATCNASNSDQYVLDFKTLNYSIKNNVVHFYGNFTVTETIQEPLEFTIIANRCSLDMKSCQHFETITLSRICTYINDENGLLASFFKGIKPTPHCPIKPGLYTFENCAMNLKFFTTFPIEGYRWQTHHKLALKGKTSKKDLYCLAGDCSVGWYEKP